MGEMTQLIKDLDRGFHHEIDAQRRVECGVTGFGYFSKLAAQRGLAPDSKEADLREREFCKRFGVTDPYGNFAERVRGYARQTWALEMALHELGLRVKGPEADVLGKFFSTTASTVLFPVFVEAQVVAGQLLTSLVPLAVAQEVTVNSHTAEHLAMSEAQGDRRTTASGEGARGATVIIRTADRTVKLEKYQAELNASYEALRLQRLNVVALFLQRLGAQIGIDETDDLIQVAIAGDGNAASAVTDTDAEVSGVLDYDELIRLSLAFPKGYEFRLAVVNDVNLRTILNMTEFKDPLAGFNYQGTGRMPSPIGAEWHRWTSTGSSAFSTDRILALDTRLALVQYTEQGVMTESDRLIDRQFERTVISKWTGFGKLDYSATQCLDITT
jgi:hypothetical protein